MRKNRLTFLYLLAVTPILLMGNRAKPDIARVAEYNDFEVSNITFTKDNPESSKYSSIVFDIKNTGDSYFAPDNIKCIHDKSYIAMRFKPTEDDFFLNGGYELIAPGETQTTNLSLYLPVEEPYLESELSFAVFAYTDVKAASYSNISFSKEQYHHDETLWVYSFVFQDYKVDKDYEHSTIIDLTIGEKTYSFDHLYKQANNTLELSFFSSKSELEEDDFVFNKVLGIRRYEYTGLGKPKINAPLWLVIGVYAFYGLAGLTVLCIPVSVIVLFVHFFKERKLKMSGDNHDK